MSTLWTPDGERPIRREPTTPPPVPPSAPPRSPPGEADAGPGDPPSQPGPADEAELKAQMAELEQVARAPAEAIVAEIASRLFELAALHLSLQPPQLPKARIAIDALAALVEGMAGRLGEAEAQLLDGLAQLRMAFVEVSRLPAGPA